MQLYEVFAKLRTIGLPISYYKYITPPALPYLIYVNSDNENLMSDMAIHATWKSYDVENYYKLKDMATEKLITDALETMDIDYSETEEIYIETQKMYMKTYTIKTLNRR